MKIAFVGAGKVGAPLAAHLARAGHDVVLAQAGDGSATVEQALARSPRLSALPLLDAVRGAEIVFLATPYAANEGILRSLGDAVSGKIIVDCTNPVGPGLSHGLGSARSGAETIQSLVPHARVVKAFTVYGFENLEDPVYPGYGVRAAMPLCGDHADAKTQVSALVEQCGFEPVDVGGLVQALHLEHMTLLWIRMVRAEGHSPHFVWARLRRG